MTPKNILQSLKSGLERESEFEDKPISMKLEYCDEFAKANVAQFIDGKWVMFEVMARAIGVSDCLRVE